MAFRITTPMSVMHKEMCNLHRKCDRLTHPGHTHQLHSQIDQYNNSIAKVESVLIDNNPSSVELKFLVDDIKSVKVEVDVLKKRVEGIKSTSKSSFLGLSKKSTTSVASDSSTTSEDVLERLIKTEASITSVIKQIGLLTDTINSVDKELHEDVENTKIKLESVSNVVSNVNKELTTQKKAIDEINIKVSSPINSTKIDVFKSTKTIHVSIDDTQGGFQRIPASFIPIRKEIVANPTGLFTTITVKDLVETSHTFTIRLTEYRRQFLLKDGLEKLYAAFGNDGIFIWGSKNFQSGWVLEEVATYY